MDNKNKRSGRKTGKITVGMNHEEYIFYKLSRLSKVDKKLARARVRDLGVWTSPKKAAAYLTKYVSTIYEKINSKEIFAKKVGNKYLILTESLVLLLEGIDN